MKQDDADLGGGKGTRVATGVEPAADVSAGFFACVTCGENVTRYGRRCKRCERDLEHDRLERESGR